MGARRKLWSRVVRPIPADGSLRGCWRLDSGLRAIRGATAKPCRSDRCSNPPLAQARQLAADVHVRIGGGAGSATTQVYPDRESPCSHGQALNDPRPRRSRNQIS